MSSKSHLYYSLTSGLEIYHETNEPVSVFGKCKGFNVYVYIPTEQVKKWTLKGDFFYIDFKKEHEIFPQSIKIWGGNIVEVWQDDEEWICIIIQGGSRYDQKLSDGDYAFFDTNNNKRV